MQKTQTGHEFLAIVENARSSYMRLKHNDHNSNRRITDMAAIETTRARTASTGSFGQFFASLFAGVAHWIEARRTRAALSQLTDRELEDIGLVRRDIHTIV